MTYQGQGKSKKKMMKITKRKMMMKKKKSAMKEKAKKKEIFLVKGFLNIIRINMINQIQRCLEAAK